MLTKKHFFAILVLQGGVIINERLKKIRKSLGYTQEEFAARLGLSRNFIAQMESGTKFPSDRTLRDICREYRVNPAYLEHGIGDMFIEMTTDTVIAEWAAKVMKDQPESFRKRLVAVMATWTEDDWAWIEKQANAIVNGVKKEP